MSETEGPVADDILRLSQVPTLAERSPQGFIHVYTGDGKGKTTASLGLVMRALGQGFNVLVILFTKGGFHYGELFAVRQLRPALAKRLTVVQAGLDRIVFKANQNQSDADQVSAGWQLAQQAMASGHYDLVVLDELNIAVDLGLVPVAEVLTAMANKPKPLELVITGRRARAEVIAAAHLVSEVQPVKHYFEQGILARKGIEY